MLITNSLSFYLDDPDTLYIKRAISDAMESKACSFLDVYDWWFVSSH